MARNRKKREKNLETFIKEIKNQTQKKLFYKYSF